MPPIHVLFLICLEMDIQQSIGSWKQQSRFAQKGRGKNMLHPFDINSLFMSIHESGKYHDEIPCMIVVPLLTSPQSPHCLKLREGMLSELDSS